MHKLNRDVLFSKFRKNDHVWRHMRNLNPYTLALQNCLENLNKSFEEAAKDNSTVQFLTNMVQGRMLDHLVHRIAKYYQIEDPAFEKELTTNLVEAFSDELFARFRQKIENNPLLVFQIAKRIGIVENTKGTENTTSVEERVNRLYLAILCNYLEYDHIDDLITKLNSNPQIQQLISSALLKKCLVWLCSSMVQHPFEEEFSNV